MSCGGGFSIRERECIGGNQGDPGCLGLAVDRQGCNQQVSDEDCTDNDICLFTVLIIHDPFYRTVRRGIVGQVGVLVQ